jgi:Integrase zinc binding domain
MLMHPGIQHMEETMKMNFVWPADVFNFVQQCSECQKFKVQQKNYGDVQVGDPVFTPWEVVAVDLIGPWTIPVNCRIQHAGCGCSNSKTSDATELLHA